MRGLSALHKQPRPPLRCDNDKATGKPNARRVGNGMEGASRRATMGTLARNRFPIVSIMSEDRGDLRSMPKVVWYVYRARACFFVCVYSTPKSPRTTRKQARPYVLGASANTQKHTKTHKNTHKTQNTQRKSQTIHSASMSPSSLDSPSSLSSLATMLISSRAEGRTETPQTRKMPAPTGPASGRIAVKKGHQARSKKPTRRTF